MTEVTLAFTDVETTGLRQEEGHRIIEIAMSCWAYNPATMARRQLSSTWVKRINPLRDIDPAAQAVHKISLADLRGAPVWEDVAPIVAKILARTKVFVAHNASFDASFIALELIRVGIPLPTFDVFCTMENGRSATPMGKVPNLGELCYALGVEYDPDSAHSAAYDVDKLAECYWIGLDRGLYRHTV